MNLLSYLFLLLFSFIGTFCLVPFVNTLGSKFKIFDIPRDIESEKVKKVRIGGLGIFLPYIFALVIYLFFFNQNDNNFAYLIPYIILLSIFVASLGLMDDIFNLSPWPRLLIQFSISIFVWIIGIKVIALDFSFFQLREYIYLNKIINFLFTIVWTTGLINAINWIDGMDGLAISLLSISSLFYFISSYSESFEIICVLTSSIIGVCLGFFFFNKSPSKILMGDSGSYFLGFNIAIISLLGSSVKNINLTNFDDGIIFNLPHALFILFVPIFDMTFVILQRILNKKSPFYPDKNHIHHRLDRFGLSSNRSLLFICVISIIFGIVGTRII